MDGLGRRRAGARAFWGAGLGRHERAPSSAQAAAQTLQDEQGEMADWFHMPASRVVTTRPERDDDGEAEGGRVAGGSSEV